MSVDFKWDSPGLNKVEFIALTSLLSMRNGGQLEPLDNFDTSHDDSTDESGDETASQHTDDTTRPRQFTVSSKDILRRRFLDRFAEALAKKKDVRHVACAVMQEQEDRVRIWVARNEGFDQSDSEFLGKFASCLSNNVGGGLEGKKVPGTVPGVSIEPANPAVEAELWNILASYYEERLHYYAAKLDIPEHHDIMRHLPSRSADPAESLLSELFKSIANEGTSDINILAALSCKAHEITVHSTSKQVVSDRFGQAAPLVLSQIRFLARLRTAHRVFIEIAQVLPSFDSVEIIPLHIETKVSGPPRKPLKLAQALALIGKDCSQTTIQTFVHKSWPLERSAQAFNSLQKQRVHVHAEVQTILGLAQSGVDTEQLFNYMGCSKRNCYLCKAFIVCYGFFDTRGCHGKLYSRWTVPNASGISPTTRDRLVKAITGVQHAVGRELGSPIPPTRAHLPESTLGVTSSTSSRAGERQNHKDETVLASIPIRECAVF
jgi:hypothetical protein